MLVVASPEGSTYFISSQHSIIIGCCFTLRFTNDVTMESVTIYAYQAPHNLATMHVLHDLEALSLNLLVDVLCNLNGPGSTCTITDAHNFRCALGQCWDGNWSNRSGSVVHSALKLPVSDSHGPERSEHLYMTGR